MRDRGEVWGGGVVPADRVADIARRYEEDGFDGFFVVDSQSLAPDPWVNLGAAAAATARIGLGVAVTNPYTRHPAVTANAAASLQRLSGGRAVLGIGRGDSSLVDLGLAPAPLPAFRSYLERVIGYLHGEAAPPDDPPAGWGRSTSVGVADATALNGIKWLEPTDVPVPVEVTATGPRVIALAATVADRVTFAVGADPERIAWALACAREARGARLPVDAGVWLPVAPHPDPETSRRLVAGSVAASTRLATMHGRPVGPTDAETAAQMEAVRAAYDMRSHAQAGTPQTAVLSADYVDRFAVTGTPERCVERIRQILQLGIARIYVSRGWAARPDDDLVLSQRLFAREVLPHIGRVGQAVSP